MNQDIISENLAVVEAHFHREAANEVEEAVKLYTEDIVWEAPNRNLVFVGKDAVADNYRKMFASAKDLEFSNLQRFATEDRVVDDSIVTFEVTGDGFVNAGLTVGEKVRMRLVHIFEMRDAKISKEIAFEMMRVE